MNVSFNIRNSQHTFFLGAAVASVLGGLLYALFPKISGGATINRYDVESRYTDAIECNGTVYISGQIGEGDNIEEQTRSALHCVDLALAKAGTDKSKVLECTCYLTDMADYMRMNSVYDEWIEGIKPPTRTVLEVKLFHRVCKVEFKCIATLG